MEKYDEIMALLDRTAKDHAEHQAEYDKRQVEADKRSAALDAKLAELSKFYGGVADNQGSAAEEFFFNSLKAKPVIGGIKYDEVKPNICVDIKGKQAEFDLRLINGNSVAIVEVKHKAHLSGLEQLQKQLVRYRKAFPEHASYKLYGGIAGLSVPEDVAKEAHQRGFFVLKQQGKVITADTKAMRAF